MQAGWEEKICRQTAMAYFPLSGITLHHIYFDEKKQPVVDVKITPEVCGIQPL